MDVKPYPSSYERDLRIEARWLLVIRLGCDRAGDRPGAATAPPMGKSASSSFTVGAWFAVSVIGCSALGMLEERFSDAASIESDWSDAMLEWEEIVQCSRISLGHTEQGDPEARGKAEQRVSRHPLNVCEWEYHGPLSCSKSLRLSLWFCIEGPAH